MLTTLLAAALLSLPWGKTLAVQVALDQAGLSCNTIDGVWGPRSQRALDAFLAHRRRPPDGNRAPTPEEAYDLFFATRTNLFRTVSVTRDDLDALVSIPASPAEKARLAFLGYESLREKFAESGHLSVRALERLNPHVDWTRVAVGTKILLPAFPPVEEELAVWPKGRRNAPKRPEAARVTISLSRFEIAAYDAKGRLLALFPCSIAAQKAKIPSRRDLRIATPVAWPNYTYTPDAASGATSRHIYGPGPNSPVGVAWLGLDLPSYGIHGTPTPHSVGRAESHGCFRLANWNAARLYGLVRGGTRVTIED